jgi:hypothetical protein
VGGKRLGSPRERGRFLSPLGRSVRAMDSAPLVALAAQSIGLSVRPRHLWCQAGLSILTGRRGCRPHLLSSFFPAHDIQRTVALFCSGVIFVGPAERDHVGEPVGDQWIVRASKTVDRVMRSACDRLPITKVAPSGSQNEAPFQQLVSATG